MKIDVNASIIDINNSYARENRALLKKRGILTINIMGSPGAGKTTLLERLLGFLQKKMRVAVIEGDLATAKDAERIAAYGAKVIQINTDGGCHLDAKMVARVIPAFDLSQIQLLLIENVGNLVCPAGFDLGEDIRMVVMSVTEGSDKPAKYPSTFLAADWLVITKTDLLPYTDFDVAAVMADVRRINPRIEIFLVSCRPDTLQGLEKLSEKIAETVALKRIKA